MAERRLSKNEYKDREGRTPGRCGSFHASRVLLTGTFILSPSFQAARFSRAFRDQPWLAIPWSHAQRRERLAALYGVPVDANRLVLLSADGQTISRDAAALVEIAHTCANAQATEGKKGGELAEEETTADAERAKLKAMRGTLEPARLKAALAASALARQVWPRRRNGTPRGLA